MTATTAHFKAVVSIQRGIFMPLIGAHASPAKVHDDLKRVNARISLEHVKDMIEGRINSLRDFEVIDVSGSKTLESMQESFTKTASAGTAKAPKQKATNIASVSTGARGRGRTYSASGDVKPLKRGTTYANIMEMLVKGATMKQMLEKTGNATAGGVNDILSWQVKSRGYGLNFDQSTGIYKLVFPKGQTELIYKD